MFRLFFATIIAVSSIVFFVLVQQFLRLDKITQIPQSTIIQDRNGNELFRFFEEDRRWLTYEEISPHMIDAIIAVEDQTFWENNGTDKAGLMRAIWANIQVRLYGDGQLQWGSTLTQQLVKNIYLTKEKTISRKLQELVLAWQLTNKRTELYREEWLAPDAAKRKAKESLVTAYLNYVFFGNRSYGIDAAARHYFKVAARDLTLLQSAILAALPQAPSIYNPSVNQASIMWSWFVSPALSWWVTWLALNMSGAEWLVAQLQAKPFQITTTCLADLVNRATVSSWTIQMVYTHWRKDRVLCRLRETKKIEPEQIKDSFLSGKDIVFYKPSYAIKAPHFVFWIQQKLLSLPVFAEKELTYEQLSQWGYTVVTTLDLDMQQAAEDALGNYTTWLERLWGNNRAMLHVQSTNGDVLSYVWSIDFFDEARDGQVDVLRAIRQVGSTLKPFFYAYLLTHYPFTIEGNIVDFPISAIWPQNHDKAFRGKTSLATALAWSRNLPVVRIFLALGGAKTFVPYLQALWFTSLDDNTEYDYPLALGANEMTLLQLSQAYIQLSTTGEVYPQINPLLRITDSDGEVVYQKPMSRFKKIIPDTVGDMLWRILANPSNMPTDRRWLRNMDLDHMALKTGTSDAKVGTKILPRDGVSVIYTPTEVIVSRAGNTDGKAMWPKAFGGEINHYPLREYISAMVKKQKIIDQPRITTSSYTTGGWYAGVDHQELTKEQTQLLRRGSR